MKPAATPPALHYKLKRQPKADVTYRGTSGYDNSPIRLSPVEKMWGIRESNPFDEIVSYAIGKIHKSARGTSENGDRGFPRGLVKVSEVTALYAIGRVWYPQMCGAPEGVSAKRIPEEQSETGSLFQRSNRLTRHRACFRNHRFQRGTTEI